MHDKKSETRGISDDYDCRMFGLKLGRAVLYSRIDSAVDRMFDQNIVDEVRRLKGRKLSLTAEKALGIKEISSFLEGKVKLDQAREELKKNTRNYAKRQMTWFRKEKRILWLDFSGQD